MAFHRVCLILCPLLLNRPLLLLPKDNSIELNALSKPVSSKMSEVFSLCIYDKYNMCVMYVIPLQGLPFPPL